MEGELSVTQSSVKSQNPRLRGNIPHCGPDARPHRQESPGESPSPAHFLQLYPVGQDWATAMAHCLPRDGNTALIRKMGGSWWGCFGFSGIAFTPRQLTDRKAQPPNQSQRRFLQEGLNRRLPRQLKPALELASL